MADMLRCDMSFIEPMHCNKPNITNWPTCFNTYIMEHTQQKYAYAYNFIVYSTIVLFQLWQVEMWTWCGQHRNSSSATGLWISKRTEVVSSVKSIVPPHGKYSQYISIMVKDGDNIHHYNGCHVNHDDGGNGTVGFSHFDDDDEGDDDSENTICRWYYSYNVINKF